MTILTVRLLALAAVLSFVFPTLARAEQGEASTARAAPMATDAPRTWYGWQVLAVDGASALSLTTAAVLASTAFGARGSGLADGASLGLLFGGAGIYMLGSPIVHAAHGRPAATAASVGVRVGLLTAGYLLGGSMAPPCQARKHAERKHDEFAFDFDICTNGLKYGIYGALLGAVVASVADASILAYAAPPRREPTRRPTLGLAPQVDPARGTYGISLYGVGL